jgi:hypothetical protein
MRPGGNLVNGITQGLHRLWKLLRSSIAVKPATFIAVVLTLTSAMALPGILTSPISDALTVPAAEAGSGAVGLDGDKSRDGKAIYLFQREEMTRDNEIYIKTKYKWGSVESFEEETELRVKAWNDLEMELEYERVAQTPDYYANLKWKVEIEVEAEVVTFDDVDGNGVFDKGVDKVVDERMLVFNDIQWFLDPVNERSVFVITDQEGLMEVTITIHRGLTEPDGKRDNEPWGSFSFNIVSLCSEDSTHMAMKVKVRYNHPDYTSELIGYLVSDCSEGLSQDWKFPSP